MFRPGAPVAGLATVYAGFKGSVEAAMSSVPAHFPKEQAMIYTFLLSHEAKFYILISGLQDIHAHQFLEDDFKNQKQWHGFSDELAEYRKKPGASILTLD